MVFESLINPIQAEKKPWRLFFIGLIYSSVAIILSLFIFRDYSSLVMIFLTVLAAVPLIYATIKIEEKKDMVFADERALIREHGKALSFFILLFLGFVVSFSIWYSLLPEETTSILFQTQVKEINQIKTVDYGPTGNSVNIFSTLGQILLNNLWVLLFSLLFSFFYGVGSIFILTWNASIIGAAVGIFVKGSMYNYFLSIPIALLRYSIHGIPEMLAYFTAGLAGGIISIAIIRHDFNSEKFRKIVIDSADLVLLSLAVLFIAALLEVFVTPVFF